MTLPRATIAQLNAAFIRLTGYPQPMTFHAEQVWHQWLRESDPPWTQQDLELVVAYIRRHMRKSENQAGYTIGSLRFSRLIQDTQNFVELLGMARAEARLRYWLANRRLKSWLN